MKLRDFGKLGSVSALTLGGGGLGQIWGATTRKECVATAHEALDLGINMLDMAPSYGDGEAERVIGETFEGNLPEEVCISTKCRVGDTPPDEIFSLLDKSINSSLKRMNLDHVDIFFLHGWVTADDKPNYGRGTPRSSVENGLIPAMEKIIESGRALSWGLTGIGDPDVLIDMLNSGIKPDFIQIVTNLLDSPGNLQYPDCPAKPREIMASASRAGTYIMGIRAVQAGALTSKLDRMKPEGDPELLDFQRSGPFRQISKEIGLSPAFLAHQYAISMEGPSTIVLGVKNRQELYECIEAEAAGPMDSELMKKIEHAQAIV